MSKLTLESVRALASKHEATEIIHDEQFHLIAFSTKADPTKGDSLRVNIWYNTGTVGRVLDHPRLFHTQIFKSNCHENDLNAIFSHPRRYPQLGYRFKKTEQKRPQIAPEDRVMTESAALELQLAKLVSEQREMAKERAALEALLTATAPDAKLDTTQKKGDNKTNMHVTYGQITHGKNVCYSLRPKHRKAFESSWNDENYLSVSLAKGFITILPEGKFSYSVIPHTLYQKLTSRKSSEPHIICASLGSEGRYYIRFNDGEWQALGSDSLVKEIDQYHCGVEKIAFGPKWGSYFIKFQDGATVWQDMPLGLHNKLKGRQANSPHVTHLSISPSTSSPPSHRRNNQAPKESEAEVSWFVRFSDGSWEARALPDDVDTALKTLHKNKQDVQEIMFGELSQWLIRSTPSTEKKAVATAKEVKNNNKNKNKTPQRKKKEAKITQPSQTSRAEKESEPSSHPQPEAAATTKESVSSSQATTETADVDAPKE